MSPILDLQRRMRELGRIRTGVQVVAGNGKRRPSKLDTFRLTSASRELLEAAAEVYGGKVEPWPEQASFQITTNVDAMDILVPPGQTFSQWYELWSGGGCQRRCDGELNVITDQPCSCPVDPAERRELAAKGEACKPTSRLNVILPALPDLGVWRLESHGFYAAVELSGTAAFLEAATASGRLLPARLRLDQREKKEPGKPTNRYSVPVIELPQTRIAELVAGTPQQPAVAGPSPVAARELAAGEPAASKTPNRRQRVERPAIGGAPQLPDGRGHERPAAAFGQAPERVGGWDVEADDPGPAAPQKSTETSATPPPAPTSTPAAPAAAAPAPRAQGKASLCLKPSPYGDGQACGLPKHPADELHKSIDQDGAILGSWK